MSFDKWITQCVDIRQNMILKTYGAKVGDKVGAKAV